jgi:hypothetical protein
MHGKRPKGLPAAQMINLPHCGKYSPSPFENSLH